MTGTDQSLWRDGQNWTEEEITIALALYYVTPYAKISSTNPQIIELAAALGRKPGSVSMKLSNLAFCDPAVRESGRMGSSNGSKKDRLVWERYYNAADTDRLTDDVRRLAREMDVRLGDWFDGALAEDTSDGPGSSFDQVPDLPTEALCLVRARVGQDYFRRTVLAKSDGCCAVTGTTLPKLMDAAHILPWNDFPAHRRDVRNGIMLTKTLHAAFDAHLMGITPWAQIIISPRWMERCGTTKELAYLESLNGREVNLGKRFRPTADMLQRRYELYLEAQ